MRGASEFFTVPEDPDTVWAENRGEKEVGLVTVGLMDVLMSQS